MPQLTRQFASAFRLPLAINTVALRDFDGRPPEGVCVKPLVRRGTGVVSLHTGDITAVRHETFFPVSLVEGPSADDRRPCLRATRRHHALLYTTLRLTLGASYSTRSFCLLGIQNTPPLLRSRRKPLLAGHGEQSPAHLGYRAGLRQTRIPVDLLTRIRLCGLIPMNYSYHQGLHCWSRGSRQPT